MSSMLEMEAYMQKFPLGDEPNYLAYRYPHAKDKLVKFEEKTHTYFINYENETKDPCFSSTGIVSVSQLVHRYFSKFDADEVIRKMRSRPSWNRNNKYFGMTNDEIKSGWSKSGEIASARGTWLHGQLERYWNGADLANTKYHDLTPIRQFFNWKSAVCDGVLQPLRTELRLVTDESLKVVGTADFIAIPTDHPDPVDCGGILSVYLIDWKFSKGINYTNPVKAKGNGVCSELEDTNFYHYSLQQNIYKWILENYYGSWVLPGNKVYTSLKVESMQLAVFHENHGDSGMVVVLPDQSDIVASIIEEQRNVNQINVGN